MAASEHVRSYCFVFEDESHSSVEQALARAKSSPTFSGKVEALRVMTVATENFPKLLESGVLLSKGKDVEAIKHVGSEILKTVIALTVAILGGKQIKDAAELISTHCHLSANALKLFTALTPGSSAYFPGSCR